MPVPFVNLAQYEQVSDSFDDEDTSVPKNNLQP